MAGEITAIVFATCFHLTHAKIFELVETTLIAILVSFHMIKSRNDHWDREVDLERDMIGLQFYIEHHLYNDDDDAKRSGNNQHEKNDSRRHSRSLSNVDVENSTAKNKRPSRSNDDASDAAKDDDIERGDGGLVPQSDMTNMSSFTASRSTAVGNNANNTGGNSTTHTWWNHFFEHFLDGSAGVMYTSFLGLIIDEIVNFGSSSSAKY